MMQHKELAESVLCFLKTLPQVKQCGLYGSLAENCADEYSDIDIQADVSGTDNGSFALALPRLLSRKFPIIFYDFAPSLAPEQYVVTLALDARSPFMLVDLSSTADPHCANVSKQALRALNNRYDHVLKLFSANLKHFIRGADCSADIFKMQAKLFSPGECTFHEDEALKKVYRWLKENAPERRRPYVASFARYL